MTQPEITVLIAVRKNSKYLAKFLFGLFENTSAALQQRLGMEVLVMMNEHDTWNRELVSYFEGRSDIRFYYEDLQLGRGGLHRYFNELVPRAQGKWIVYFCEDHFVTMPNWDRYVLAYINGEKQSGDSAGKRFPLDPREPWVLVPKFDNCGAMNHIVSRGFIAALDGVLGNHGWIDSYINDLMAEFPERRIRMDDEMFHDFTHDRPSPMDDAHLQSVVSAEGKKLPKYEDPAVRHLIAADQDRLRLVINQTRLV